MRGRSLLKETSCPSLCAFCAHRLGQARTPSHVQRRFIQSSRPVSKPSAEAAALREEPETRPAQPTWGRSGPVERNGPSIATWGRVGAGIPSKQAGNWGTAVPAGKSEQLRSAGIERASSSDGNLLPHEAAARAMMLERSAEAQKRPLQKHLGPGPQSTRAGRPEPRPREEMMDSARRTLARRKAFDSPAATEKMINESGPRISRHLIDSSTWTPQSRNPESEDHINSRWGQLRRRGETASDDHGRPPTNRFVDSRTEREAQARTSGYKPISSRSFKPIYDPQPTQQVQNSDQQSKSPIAPSSWGLSRGTPDRSSFTSQYQSRENYEVTRELDSRSESATTFASKMTTNRSQEEDAEEEREERDGRQKKSRTRRGISSEQPTYDALPKGKDRDKAKRRQQFSRNEEDDAERDAAEARAEAKKQRKLEKAAQKAAQAAAPTPMLLPEYISVANLALALKVRLEQFVRKMQELGFEETNHDHILNAENAGLIAMEYNFEPIIERGESEDLKAREPALDQSILPQRPPVVTIMGHVDHGKTTLLDWLRKSSVAATEHGGITQHIGAFSVPMPSGKVITFLDTPGHAAFLSMRQRGANVTDIVILVVAADDSVKPQTIEAINHAKAARVPMIVAINKIDKDQANVERVKQDLARHGVEVEDFGGDTQAVCVSGKTGQGMSELEEAAVTLSEILDMRAETDGQAEGWVLEASVKSVGKVATVLVRRGTMRPGDFIVAGNTWARIRCLRNEAGVEISEAGPGTPVEVDGWREQPEAGDEVLQASDEAKAKSVIGFRLEKKERDKMAEDMEAINDSRRAEQEKRDREKAEALAEAEAKAANEELPEKERDSKPTGPKEVFFVIKGDVSGSVEAVVDSISAIGTKEVRPHILRSGVGQVSEFDIEHAAAAKGLIINFNTVVEPNIARLAHDSKVRILDHNIIYRLVDDVKAELSNHLPPLITQRVLGEAEIAQIFSITVKGRQQKSIAGCKVRNGTISKTAKVRVLRKGEKVYEGTLASLKNVKKDVSEMKKGSECGMGFDDWFDFHVGDQIQSYEEKEEKRYL